MKVFYRVVKWMFYSVLLSFLPAYVNGFLLLIDKLYKFNWISTLTDILISDFCLALTVLVESFESGHNGNNSAVSFIKGIIIAMMILVCSFTAIFYGWSLNAEEGQINEGGLKLLVGVLLFLTIFFGILARIFLDNSDDISSN